ncbi:hypothetical protein WA1_49305 [Scytonema hofmannii PCC 7110]|uniref:Uncharacterized protein n=1 Tax=Scytonema hofmannii PCC 7110 TaxID=128403 RepID=A0A139WQM7_9CYAN|nr:hypothetical protein [Scytonema hofmannii]KYC34738.1 hypothetical protein WA1_49305 [Scytonema hofmannii PCC 7110]
MNLQAILTALLTVVIYTFSTFLIWQFVLGASVEFSKIGEKIVNLSPKIVADVSATPLIEKADIEMLYHPANSESQTNVQPLLQPDEIITTAKKTFAVSQKTSLKRTKQPKVTVASLRKQCDENGIKWSNAIIDQNTGKPRHLKKEEMKTKLALSY